jgi:predicted metal-binding membrane protein
LVLCFRIAFAENRYPLFGAMLRRCSLPAMAVESALKRNRLVVGASIVALCLLAWLFLFHLARQMESMDGMAARMMGMPVDDRLASVLSAAVSPQAATLANATVNFTLVALMWAVMMVGMMLPSAAPTILLFSALERKRGAGEPGGRIVPFVAGYFAVWSIFAAAAAAMQTILAQAGLVDMQMAATSTFLAGGIFVAAGIYEFTPLKNRCLVHCRSPLQWIPQHMRPGRIGAFRMGAEHGTYCVGCCWMLMLLLFVGGVMNLLWVAVIAILVLAQKIMPGGRILSRLSGAGLVAIGAFLLAGPLFF